MDTSIVLLATAIAVGSVGGFAAFYAVALAFTRPHRPAPAPATQDLPGAEPPAVVSLLAAGWDLTEDAADATLIDLAARRYLEFRQPADDPAQTTIHIRDPRPSGLNRYEQRIFDRVAGLAVGGVLPLSALSFRDPGRSAAFDKRLRAEVIADARARGLSRRRFGPAILAAVTVAAIVAGAGVAGAALLLLTHTGGTQGSPIKGALGIWFGIAILLIGIGHRNIGERDTAAGRAVAARWLGVRTWLANTEAFADLPPSAVTIWDRYLSYGNALGTTRVCSAVIDLGMGNRKHLWSSFGGTWHRVRVRYPKFWPRYGRTARRLIIRGIIAVTIGVLLLLRGADLVARFGDLISGAGRVLGALLAVHGLYLLVRSIVDQANEVQLTGEVLWKQVWRLKSEGDSGAGVPWLHYLAVDDGTGARTTAWGLPSAMAGGVTDGDTVRLTARRWSRRIVELSVVAEGNARRWGKAANEATSVTGLLRAGEVGQVLGHPVIADAGGGAGRRSTQEVRFLGFDHAPLLRLTVTSNSGGKIWLLRRDGQPLAGIGDKAYAAPTWAMARYGDTLISLQLLAGPLADPNGLRWLLATATARLGAATRSADKDR